MKIHRAEQAVDIDAANEVNVDVGGMQDKFGLDILDWDEDLQSQVEANIKSVHENVASALQLEEKKYEYVQLAGLSLYTFPQSFLEYYINGAQPFYTGIDKIVHANMGSVVNNVHDANARVDIMIKMMDAAYESKFYSKDASVLKIFMAPEFFFRGPHGAYNMLSLDGCSNKDTEATGVCNAPILTIMTRLVEEVKKDKWADWLFVFGTIVSVPQEDWSKAQYWNFAPIMRGGPQGVKQHHIVPKTYVSHIDFLDCDSDKEGKADANITESRCHADPYSNGVKKYALFSESQKSSLKKLGFDLQENSNIFHSDGIKFGMEVCLDHAKEMLRWELGPDVTVDVHLITSAGMSIGWSGAKKGPVFLQDGGVRGARTSYHCPHCSYLGEGVDEAPGYSDVERVSQEAAYFKDKENLASMFTVPRAVSTPRDNDTWFSKFGFGTEGTGLGVDPRFRVALVDGIFATDSYKPEINFSPAFKLGSGPKIWSS